MQKCGALHPLKRTSHHCNFCEIPRIGGDGSNLTCLVLKGPWCDFLHVKLALLAKENAFTKSNPHQNIYQPL